MANIYRVRTVFSGVQGAPWLSTLYFAELGGTAQQAATAAGAFWNAADALMQLSVSWTTEAAVFTLDETSGQPVSVANTTPVTGTGALGDHILPITTQGLVRLRTGVFLNGREVRGRIFVPGYTEINSNGGPSATVLSTLNAAGAALIADANSIFAVWSRTNGVAQSVSAVETWNQWAVLRSRRD